MFKRNPQCIIHLSTETGTPPIPVFEKRFVIGRKPTHLVSIPDNSISRDHVEIIIKDDEAYVKDLGTSNGTQIDGHLISPQIPIPCREGQIITLGHSTIGIVIEIFSKDKDKKKSKSINTTTRQQQPDSQPLQYNPGFIQSSSPTYEYSTEDEPENNNYNQQAPPPYADQAYQSEAYKPHTIPQDSIPQISGNSEQEIMDNARDEANRILARAKVEGESHVRELIRSKEADGQNIITLAQQKSMDKIRETEQQVQDLLKNANTQALELVKNAQTQSQEMLKLAQEQTQCAFKKADDEALKLKELILEDGRKEKQRIVEGAYLERESVLKETEQLKQSIPEIITRSEAIQAEIEQFKTQKNTAETEYTAQLQKMEAAVEQVKTHESQVSKLQEDYKQVGKEIELAEEKYKATVLSVQSLVQETQDTLARVTRRESELNGLVDGAKLQKDDAEKYSTLTKQDADKYAINVKQDADKYSINVKQDADKYSIATKQDADKFSGASKQEADKYSTATKQDANKYAELTKQNADTYAETSKLKADKYTDVSKLDADKYSTATKDDADKYSTATKADADKYSNVTKQSADKYSKVTKEETDTEVSRKLEFLQQETKKILADRERIFQDMKIKQETILQELKASEDSKTKSILEIDGLLKGKKTAMDQELDDKLAVLNTEFNAEKEVLEKEYLALRNDRENEFKNIRMQQDSFLNEMRRTEEDKIRRMLEESQRMVKTQRDAKINHVNDSLENFFNELEKTASGDVTEHLPLLRTNLKRLMNETLANEYAGEESQLRKILDYNPEIANNHKKFWKKAAIASMLAITAFSASIYYRAQLQQIPQQMQESVQEIDKENKLATQQHLEAIRLASIYRPEQDLNFKFNYTDNVIFTKNYLDFEFNDAVQKEWNVMLNKFLLDTVVMSEDEAIQFMGSESSLIRNLESKKALIEGKNPESGIKNMRVTEDEYQKIIHTTLKKYTDEFWNLKKELYIKFMQENSQRFPAEENK